MAEGTNLSRIDLVALDAKMAEREKIADALWQLLKFVRANLIWVWRLGVRVWDVGFGVC